MIYLLCTYGDCAALEKTQLGEFSENSQSILKTAITVL